MSGLVSAVTGLSAGSFGLLLASFFVPGPSMVIIAMLLQVAIFALALVAVRKMRNAGLTRHTPKSAS
jgi:hypothetical protein